MAPAALNELFTLLLAILAILLGIAMNARSAALRASNIPSSVVGGLVFAGFALGAMPVGLATMRRLAESLGPAPRAFLVITLAASLFADAANAIGITTLFALLK